MTLRTEAVRLELTQRVASLLVFKTRAVPITLYTSMPKSVAFLKMFAMTNPKFVIITLWLSAKFVRKILNNQVLVARVKPTRAAKDLPPKALRKKVLRKKVLFVGTHPALPLAVRKAMNFPAKARVG